jgi:hypothetical protein
MRSMESTELVRRVRQAGQTGRTGKVPSAIVPKSAGDLVIFISTEKPARIYT